MEITIVMHIPKLLLVLVFGAAGCTVGLAKHPLAPAQAAALRSRPAPTAEDSVPGFTTVRVEVPIDASPERVWEQLAVRYGEVHRWSSAVSDSEFVDEATEGGPGAVRSCTLADDAPIGRNESFRETILDWDATQRYFVAGVDDGFYPMRQVAQEFWVLPAADGSVVVTQFHYDLAFPMGSGRALKRRMKPAIVRSVLGLKHLIETGDAAAAQDPDRMAQRYPEVLAANGV